MPWKQIKNYTKTVIFQSVSKNTKVLLLAPVKSGDIVYYRGNCIVKVDTQTIPSDIPTTIVKGGYLTLESGTLEYGWLKKQYILYE